MKVCWRGIHRLQIVNSEGDIRTCGWVRDGTVGNILTDTIPEIMHGKKMHDIVTTLANADYSRCLLDRCPYLSNDRMDEMLIEVNEIPDYPEFLSLSYENNCNYHCTVCTEHSRMEDAMHNDYRSNLDEIDKRLEEILPHIKYLSAHGTSELFACPHVLSALSSWKPLAPAEECKVALETNGSLFTPDNWKKIENLGNYDLRVYITIMSFQEDTYQFLSGTRMPISTLKNNLRFVRSLREKNIINKLHLGTVLQEANFREVPQFIRMCLDEYGADQVFVHQVERNSGGIYNQHIQWFWDVRNPEHPYYNMYRKILADPIFQDPRVMLDAGFLPSHQFGEHPGIKFQAISKAISKMLDNPELLLPHLMDNGKIGIFGMGPIGKMVVSQYKDKLPICNGYASKPKINSYMGVPVSCLPDADAAIDEAPDTVLVTAYTNFNSIAEEIRTKLGVNVKIVNFWRIFSD